MASEERFIETGRLVCVEHFTSQTARQCVADSAEAQTVDAGRPLECFACQRTPAGSLDTLIQLVLEKASWLYQPYETSTAAGRFHKEFGDQSADTYQMIELLTGADDPACVAIVEALDGSEWISTYWERGDLSEQVIADWEEFTLVLQHRARFTVLEYLLEHEPQLYTVVAGTLAQLSDASLRTVIPAGTAVYRSRTHEGLDAEHATVDQIMPPPPTLARAGRMNPAGIPLFYAAQEVETALAEVFGHSPTSPYAVYGAFVADADIVVLDLTGAPYPVDFLTGDREQVTQTVFLNRFVDSICRPVDPAADPQGLNYLPTQYLVEAIQRSTGVMTTLPAIDVDGIAYPSAVHPNGRNLVLFEDRLSLPTTDANPKLPLTLPGRPRLTMTACTWRKAIPSWVPVAGWP
ncbi:RES domain-containing protein [Mycobacterium sp. 050128]|uniref:RES domain-containing protein n=1 Tax=Mycobacterium sp. 050128 TaxID=3096112 RepID=UPI002EDA5888